MCRFLVECRLGQQREVCRVLNESMSYILIRLKINSGIMQTNSIMKRQ